MGPLVVGAVAFVLLSVALALLIGRAQKPHTKLHPKPKGGNRS